MGAEQVLADICALKYFGSPVRVEINARSERCLVRVIGWSVTHREIVIGLGENPSLKDALIQAQDMAKKQIRKMTPRGKKEPQP